MDPLARTAQLVSDAARAHSRGDLAQAENLCTEALELSPSDPQATLLLGVLMAKTNRLEAAVVPLSRVVRDDPSSFFARYWLAAVFRRLRRLDEAAEVGFQALRLKPDDVQALIEVGSALLDLHRYPDAGPIFTRAVRLAPRDAAAHEGLGMSLEGTGRERDAIKEFQAAHTLAPTSESAALRLGSLLLNLQDFPGAGACAMKVLTHHPSSNGARQLMARALMDQGRGAEALSYASPDSGPPDAPALAVYGSVLQNLGRIEEAESAFRSAIELDPKLGQAYFALVHNARLKEADRPLLEAMGALRRDPSIAPQQLVHLEYALGKAHQDFSMYEQAMAHYDEANRLSHALRFQGAPYDRQAHQNGFEAVQRTITPEFLRSNRGTNPSNLPLLVVGMMRSGTTLVEQILSSHSQIAAAGEQPFWPRHHAAILHKCKYDLASATRLAAEYVQLLSSFSAMGSMVIDKLPVNYSFLGLIHCALPNARFIHVQRHPVDTCLSIYFTPNRSRIEWAHDKSNIAFAYRQYASLMNHWTQVIPPDRLLHVTYEDLVLNREETTRKMLDFAGVPWEDACLRPEDNQRSVLTPSVWQVRQPVYSSSLNRWRNYEPWLGAFGQLLEPLP